MCAEISFPKELIGVPLEMGIDETGRGSVLGPLIYCCAFAQIGFAWPESVDDSKRLKPGEREEIAKTLDGLPVGFAVRTIGAEEISTVMLGRSSGNLNSLSFAAARDVVQAAVDAGLSVERLFVDTVGNPDYYREYLSRRFSGIDITVCEKADAKYKVVGAASIKAKVLRDAMMRDIQIMEPGVVVDREFGSGYPGDPITEAWMSRNFDRVFGFPGIARFSWTSVSELFRKNDASAVWDAVYGSSTSDSAFHRERQLRPVDLGW